MSLACDGPGQQRLTGSRRTEQQHPVGHPTTEPLIAVGCLEEVDDLGQLALGLVDPGDVIERHADLLRVDAPGLRATEVAQAAKPSSAALSSPGDQHKQSDQQQGWPEPDQQLADQRRARVRVLRVDLDLLGLEQSRQRGVVPEARNLGREQRRRRGLRVIWRVTDLGRERALDRVGLRGDRLDLARVQLLKEVGAEWHLHSRLPTRPGEQHGQPVDRQQSDDEHPEPPLPVRRRGLGLFGHAPAVGRGRYPPASLVLRHPRWRCRRLGSRRAIARGRGFAAGVEVLRGDVGYRR